MEMVYRGALWRSKTRVYSLAGDESVGSEGVSLRHQVSSFTFGMAWRSGYPTVVISQL